MADLTKDRLADPHRIARASRYSAPESGGEALPVAYGDLTADAGADRGLWRCPRIDTGGAGTYCVAGHAVLGSVRLFDRDGEIPSGDYTLNLANDFQGQGVIATAAFSVAPSGFVEAACKGRKDASGALIENPIRIVEDLMLDVWGFTAQDIDLQALSRAAGEAHALGYRAAGVIQEDRSPADVLTELLGDFLGRFEVDPHGRLRLFLAGEETGAIFPVKVLPAFEAAEVEAETGRDSVVNQVPLLYGKSFAEGRMGRHDDGGATKEAASQALYGVRPPPGGRLELAWVRDPATARAVQRRIVERLGTPARVVTIRDTTFRALEVEPEDYVVFSVPWLRTEDLEPLANQIGQVISVAPDLREQALVLKLRETPYHLTTAERADGSKTAGGGAPAGGRRDFAAYG